MGGEESTEQPSTATVPNAATTRPATYGNHVPSQAPKVSKIVEKKVVDNNDEPKNDTTNNIKTDPSQASQPRQPKIQQTPKPSESKQTQKEENEEKKEQKPLKKTIESENNNEPKNQIQTQSQKKNETQKQSKTEKKDENITTDSNLNDLQQEINKYFNLGFPMVLDKELFDIKQEIIDLRHYFHYNPELSFAEFETAENISKYCNELGLSIKEKIGKTGLTAVLHGSYSDGPCIALRADMDALPIKEENENIAYKSQKEGVSHACGHDCHMAILLSVARILSLPKYIEKIHGSIKFIFQPGEEGGAGAKKMIMDGILSEDNELNCPEVDEIYGLHVWSYLPLGKLVCKSGPLMAGSCRYKIKVRGIGGHGAEPKGTADTVLAISNLIIQLNTIISRNLSPLESGVLSVGTIKVGDRSNIIAENGQITGTIRFMNNDIFLRIQQRIKEICNGIETSYNVKTEIEFGKTPYPAVINHPKQTENVKKAINKLLINQNVSELLVQEPHEQQTMAAEDFSFYLNQKPGCFYFLGCAEPEKYEKNEIYAHHTPHFRVDERCLILGVQIFVNLIMELMSKPSQPNNPSNNQPNDPNNQPNQPRMQKKDTKQPNEANETNEANQLNQKAMDDEKMEILPDNNNNNKNEKENENENNDTKVVQNQIQIENEDEDENQRQDTPDIIEDHEKPITVIDDSKLVQQQ